MGRGCAVTLSGRVSGAVPSQQVGGEGQCRHSKWVERGQCRHSKWPGEGQCRQCPIKKLRVEFYDKLNLQLFAKNVVNFAT